LRNSGSARGLQNLKIQTQQLSEMEHLNNFDEMMATLRKKRRMVHLLLGNGFSMAYDPSIFSYNALADFVIKINDPTLVKLFEILKTKNFELIMEQLTTFSKLLKALGVDKNTQIEVAEAHEKLKRSLLEAIKSLHPEHVFKIPPEKMAACGKFFHQFVDTKGEIFSTNYDLLVYWVLMRQGFDNAVDGFGREILNPIEHQKGDEEAELSELKWGPNRSRQNIHFLHGTLPIFDVGTDIIKEKYSDAGYLLENVGRRLDAGQYPVFVTAGNGEEKLALIRHNQYLSSCYDQLCNIDGSLVSFGFGFGGYDEHIIDALNKAARPGSNASPKLRSIYIGVYSEKDRLYIESISSKFYTKLYTFDVKTASPWK
jgi:hypothetical protein